MGLQTPDEIVPWANGDFGVVRDTNLIGGWRVVLTHAARDAITKARRVGGMRVRTVSDGKEWVLADDLLAWTEASDASGSGGGITDNFSAAIALALTTPSSFFHAYVAGTTGDDSAGSGLVDAPFRTMQRVVEGLVAAAATNKALTGQLVVHCDDTFHARGFVIPRLGGAPALFLGFVTGETTLTKDFGVISSSVHPPNPDRPAKLLGGEWASAAPGGFDHTVLTHGSHWLHLPTSFGPNPTDLWPYGVLVSDLTPDNTALWTLDKTQPEAYGASAFFLRPFGGVLCADASDPTVAGSIVCINDNEQGAVTASMAGFKIGNPGNPDQSFLTVRNVSLAPCSLYTVAWISLPDDNAGVDTRYAADGNCFISHLGGANTFFTMSSLSEQAFAGSVSEVFLQGEARAEIFIGGATGGRAPSLTGYEQEFFTSRAQITVEGGQLRLGNHSPVGMAGSPSYLCKKGARINSVHCNGTSTVVPFVFNSGSGIVGDGEFSAVDVTNSTDPGQEVQVDDVVTATIRVGKEGMVSDGRMSTFLETADASNHEILRVKMPADDDAKTIWLDATAVSTAGVAALQRRVLARRHGGTTTQTSQTPVADANPSLGGSPDLVASVSGTDVVVSVHGVAATTVAWTVEVRVIDSQVV